MLENGALILGIFLNQQHFTQREYFSVNAVTFQILSVERGLCVHVCICMSECESVFLFLHSWCVHFLWFFYWRHGPGMGCRGKSTDFESRHCHLLCVLLSWNLGFQTHKRKTFTCSLQSCEEKMRSFIPCKQKRLWHASFLNPSEKAPKYPQ